MWYCSLCNLDLGEISAISKVNEHPTCPYCHGAVEEGTILVDVIELEPSSSSNYWHEGALEKASEQSVGRLFEIIARSLETSQYCEFKEDIVQIVKEAFEPQEKNALTEIVSIIRENLRAGADPHCSN